MTEQSMLELFSIPQIAYSIGINDEVTEVLKVDSKYVVSSRKIRKIVDSCKLEYPIIRKAIISLLPDGYRLESHTDPSSSSEETRERCMIVNTRRHLTIAYAYGKTSLEAHSKCLIELNMVLSKGIHEQRRSNEDD